MMRARHLARDAVDPVLASVIWTCLLVSASSVVLILAAVLYAVMDNPWHAAGLSVASVWVPMLPAVLIYDRYVLGLR